MKIYNKLVYDLKTDDIIEESFFEYDGIIAECGSGGGGTTTNTQDPEYNERMAAIAEAQQAMAEEYFDYYKYGSGHYGTTDKPDTSYEAYLKEYPSSSGRPAYEDFVKFYEDQWEKENIDAVWIPDEGAIGLQTLEQEQIAAQSKLLPGQTALSEEQIAAQRSLLPGYTDLSKEQIAAQRALLPQQTATASEYYTQAMKGVSAQDAMGRATSDVRQAFSGAEGAWRREAGRMGVTPSSRRYASMRTSGLMDEARAIAGARTEGRRYAEEESFSRLAGAAGGYTQ